jgi:hypothetical protein
VACVGCSIPSVTFTPIAGDAGDAGIDAPSGPPLEVSASSIQVREGMSGMVQVRLTAPSATDTNVTATADNMTVNVTPSSLVFLPASWNVFQTVAVSSMADADSAHLMTKVTFSAPGTSGASTAVVVEDDDLLIAPTSITICYDDPDQSFGIKLAAPPLATTTVTISETSNLITLMPTSLMFTTADYATAKLFTIHQDSAAGGSTTISVASSGQTTRTIMVTANATGGNCL